MASNTCARASNRSGRSHVASSMDRSHRSSPISAVAFVTLRRTCRAGADKARCAMLRAAAAAATTTTASVSDSACAQCPTRTGNAPHATPKPPGERTQRDHSSAYAAASSTPVAPHKSATGEMTNAAAIANPAPVPSPPQPKMRRAPGDRPVDKGRSWSSSRAWAPMPSPNANARSVPASRGVSMLGAMAAPIAT